MNFERKICLVIGILIALIIFTSSNTSIGGSPGTGVNLKALGYHFSIFFFLSFFILYGVSSKNKKAFFLSFLILIIYALLDEFHQYFIPLRNFSLQDILVNCLGILTGFIFYFIFKKVKKLIIK
jgi:VanZ family protein